MLILVPDGPFKESTQKMELTALYKVFGKRNFRSAAFGYFGHMLELYAFWAFIPSMLSAYSKLHPETITNIPVLTFVIIGLGGLACV
jgi:hypothetical protein